MQTSLKSDNFCGYNQAASPFFWTFMPGQYVDTHPIGEVGVPAGGGMAGSYPTPEVVDVWSFLSGRDNILSKCTPPTPSLESLNKPADKLTETLDVNLLIPKVTKESRSANSVDSIDYNRWQPALVAGNPQNLRYVIEDVSNQRGGFNTRNFVKSSWSNQNNASTYDPRVCGTMISPARVCGPECAGINGYSGAPPVAPGKPQQEYPFVDITSQQIASVGASDCGPQFFSGPSYDVGSCPPLQKQVFKNSA